MRALPNNDSFEASQPAVGLRSSLVILTVKKDIPTYLTKHSGTTKKLAVEFWGHVIARARKYLN